jgi:hypothetical protein
MFDVGSIISLHTDTVARWHTRDVDNPFVGFQSVVCQQHGFNFLLWHQEDIARSQNVSDSEIAKVKRAIDGLNQQRNDWIEKIDDEISIQLSASNVACTASAPLNTETPGSAIDRLSINSLRVFHLREQLDRSDVNASHLDSVKQKIDICLLQRNDLADSLQQLFDEILAGRKRHCTYRQLKMYNDPTLNPYLYGESRRQAS